MQPEEPGKHVAQKAGLNREILDTAPALFTSLFRYKVLETGGEWVEAPTRKLKPSQRCPARWATVRRWSSSLGGPIDGIVRSSRRAVYAVEACTCTGK
jgi:hypothetical protein